MTRALADQIEGDESRHAAYREEICDFIASNKDDFAPFISDDDNKSGSFDQYLASMRRGGTFGGNMELVAFARLRQVSINGM
jgi:OTU domain-containing protein 3